MAVYVVLLFDLDDGVVISADTIEARGTADARAHAARLLRTTKGASGYELWHDGTRIASSFPGSSNGNGAG
jgi:hypothetical protein